MKLVEMKPIEQARRASQRVSKLVSTEEGGVSRRDPRTSSVGGSLIVSRTGSDDKLEVWACDQ